MMRKSKGLSNKAMKIAAGSLLVSLLALGGCSNPAKDEGTSTPVADTVQPETQSVDETPVVEVEETPEVEEELEEAAPDLTAGLVATFSFEDSLEDATGQVAKGSVTGDKLNVESEDTLSYAEGVSGSALVFDGAHGVLLPENLITEDTYSVSLWLNPEVLTAYTPAFFGGKSETSWISLMSASWDNEKAMVWSGEAWYDGITAANLIAGDWSHIALTVNERELVVYVNGEESFRGEDFPNVFNKDQSFFGLGVNYWDAPYQGMLDELNIYDRALTATEVELLASIK